MEKKRLVIFSVLIILVALMVSPVFGTAYYVHDYPNTHQNSYEGREVGNCVGVAFAPSGNGFVTGVTFWFQREAGVSDAHAKVNFYAGQGSAGTTGNVTGSSLAETATLDLMTVLGGTASYYPASFNFSSPIAVVGGHVYVLMINVTVLTGTALKLSIDTTKGDTVANTVTYTAGSGAFGPSLSYDMCVQVLGDTVAVPSGSPVLPDLSNVDWVAGLSWLAVLFLMVLPPFLLGVYMRGGKWGFLIGLAIGTGLSYFVFPAMVPIWLVILVGVGLGAAFLSEIRSGG